MDMNTLAISAARFGLDLSLKVTFLLALTLLSIYGLRRLSASARHLVAMLGLAGALVLPLATAVVPSFSIPLVPSLLPAQIPATPPEARTADPGEEDSSPVAESSADGQAVSLGASAATGAAAPAASPARWTPQTAARLLVAVWIAGAALGLMRLAVGSRRVRRIADDAQLLGDAGWTEAADELGRRLGLTRSVRILASAEVPVAMTSGIRRPVLLVNEGAKKWTPERRRVVLLHELAHVGRGDWLTLVVAELAAAVYWFHPLVFLARREARRSCERACDDLVLDHGTKPSVYATHLLGIVRSLKPATVRALPVMAMARPSQFEGRMRAILDPGLHRRGPSRAETRGAALGVLCAVITLSAVQPWADRSASAAALPAGAERVASLLQGADESARDAKQKPCPKKTRPAPGKGVRPETSTPAHLAVAPEAAESTELTESGFVLASNSKGRKHDAWAFHRAAELGHRPGTSFYNEACALSLAAETAPALDALRRAIENGFDNPQHLAADNDLDAVRADPRFRELQSLAEDLSTPSIELWKGWLRSTGRPAWREAADRARKAAERHPKVGRAWFNLGYAQIRAERPEAAAESFRKALDLSYRKPTTMYNLACSYARLDQKDQAFDWLFKALDSGFGAEGTLRHDGDLDKLRRDPRFRKAQQMIDTRADHDVAEN